MTLREKIDKGTARIGIIGLGYVGLPLARAFHDAGLSVIGFDTDPAKFGFLEAVGGGVVAANSASAAETLGLGRGAAVTVTRVNP